MIHPLDEPAWRASHIADLEELVANGIPDDEDDDRSIEMVDFEVLLESQLIANALRP